MDFIQILCLIVVICFIGGGIQQIYEAFKK